jgi:hypothetical protein
MPTLISAPQDEIDADRKAEAPSGHTHGGAAARKKTKIDRDEHDPGDQQQRIDEHGRHVNDGLQQRGRGETRVERAGYFLVGNQLQQLTKRRRGRERTDAERVKEIHDDTDREFDRRRPALVSIIARGAHCTGDKGDGGHSERTIKGQQGDVHNRNIPLRGAAGAVRVLRKSRLP